ncbi:hypothetical protein BH10CHL1_BH10CHL1_37290 [soil metagenome]
MDITSQVYTYLTTAPTSHFLKRDVQIVAHWAGHDHLLWRVLCGGQEVVLKFYLDAGQARSRRQYDGQQIFARLGLAPRPIWVDRYPEGLPRQVLIYEWLPGAALDPLNAGQMAELARSVGRVHNSDTSDVRRFSPNPINLNYLWHILRGSVAPIQQWLLNKQARELAAVFADLATNLTAVIEAVSPLWANTLPTPIHGDLKLENAVDSFGAVMLLDWEMFGLGDPALEVATFLQMSQHDLDAAAQAEWLDNYLSIFDQPGLAQRIASYQRILPFQAVCFLLDGLRQHLDQPVEGNENASTEFAENLPFLLTTLQVTLAQAASALQIDAPNLEDAVQALFSF